MIRILLIAGVIGLVLLFARYFMQKSKIVEMEKRLIDKDNRIYDLEREVAELNHTIKKHLDSK